MPDLVQYLRKHLDLGRRELRKAVLDSTADATPVAGQLRQVGGQLQVYSGSAWVGATATALNPALMQVIADPAAPAEDTLAWYAKKVAGRTLPKFKGPAGVDVAVQPSFFGNFLTVISTQNSGTLSVIGNAATSVGTITHVQTEALGWMANFQSGALTGNTAGTSNTSVLWRRGSVSGGSNGFFFVARCAWPDADYGAGATGSRSVVGLWNSSLAASVASDSPTLPCASFQWSTSRGDVNWQFRTYGTAESLINTGIPFLPNKVMDFYVYCRPMGDTVFWRIDNLTDGTTAEGSTQTNLPNTPTAMRGGIQIATLSDLARNIRMQRIYCESDR